jgi:hypothetical protein
MRSIIISALLAVSLLPATALAQGNPQTAAVVSTSSASPTSSTTGGITREQYIHRAQDRAGQRAAARFDQMDTDHDGVLDRTEVRSWRAEHPRRVRPLPDQLPPQ